VILVVFLLVSLLVLAVYLNVFLLVLLHLVCHKDAFLLALPQFAIRLILQHVHHVCLIVQFVAHVALVVHAVTVARILNAFLEPLKPLRLQAKLQVARL